MRAQTRRASRMIQVGIAAGALLVASAGAAFAVRGGGGTQQVRPFQYAATFHVTAPLDAGPVEVQWPTFGAGRVGFHSNCSAYSVPGDLVAPVHMAGLPLAVWNESTTDRIGLAAMGSDAPSPTGFVWLQPKSESTDQDVWVFAPGEMLNETAPDGSGFPLEIAILDRNGTTATGTFAWSASYDPVNQVGHCTFSLQLRG